MVNRIVLVGRLTRDPELRYTPNGVPVAQFRIAVDRPFRNARGERETDFINVVAWRQSAEFVHQYLSKGRLVGVDGRLQIRSYTTQDGQQRTVADGRWLSCAPPSSASCRPSS
ncbi:MAG TPA: single-stranded DNA-binding protein [Armatimonadetes bacterium]|nr:single-stranded DNA-binding protein [Armatimonadota bacterium]